MSEHHGFSRPAEIAAYYDTFAEEARLTTGTSRLEYERTKDILLRVLPAPPARVVDVGGAAGAYSLWLAELGYDVHVVDAIATTRSAWTTSPPRTSIARKISARSWKRQDSPA